MRLKLFLMACINLFLISFPYNIIGCGPSADPYDYYVTFFDNKLSDAAGYRPFYYTGYLFLYDEEEPAKTEDVLAAEWASYASVTQKDAYRFINQFDRKDINTLYYFIEKNQPLKIPDSVKNNAMTSYFIKSKDLEGLGYILFAKQAQPMVTGSADYWEPIKRDSVKMVRLAKNGVQLYRAAKSDLFRLKYGYQVMRLYHYAGNYPEALAFYDEIKTNPTQSILQQLVQSLRAGALLRQHKNEEAAYLFSKAFASSPVKRVSNFISFDWSVDSGFSRQRALSFCRDNKEKAALLAMFILGSPNNDLKTLQEILSLDPGSPALEILAIREINKLEEKYLSPSLSNDQTNRIYYSWAYQGEDSIYKESQKEVPQLVSFLHKAAQDNGVKNPALFEVGAAYASYINKDYKEAKKYLSAAEKMNMSQKIKDQWAMTNLLVTINEKDRIDAAFEEQILPSLEWLDAKKKKDDDWIKFYRNLMTVIIAGKYQKQGDISRQAMSIGVSGESGIDFMQNHMDLKDVIQLYNVYDKPQPSKFEQYLISHNDIKKKDVIDFTGTAYLREYDFSNAITWLKKSSDKKILRKNPFIELTYDREEKLPSDLKFATTKLAFAEEMLRLQKLAETDKANAARNYYKMALGFYNITYYGHTWELVQYYRSGADGYHIPKNATAFEKEYYGCYTAEKYFRMAMQASTDPNFKATCLFMMAKCSQKQVQQPQYEDYETSYDKYEAAEKSYYTLFMKNKYYPELSKSYSNTPFYKKVFSTCSYLRDFVRKAK